MNIQEATTLAMKQGRYIMREDWQKFQAKVKPTNTSEHCILNPFDNKCIGAPAPRRGWQPIAEDLVANDWIVID
ncbi:Thoeris anti-defense Tad2 family protein [Bacillus albus]|uniref:Thoeris anti-defense Tad2 family protein n=1 Tax=Bacillus albus TaxID=2026189 RepID=UPI001021882A|nr:MW1434 family type I TA system toxin [Bacillus albus]